MSIDTPMPTIYGRIARGESWEEAVRPSWQPLWMHRIEQAEGRPLRDLLAEGADAAAQTGYSLRDLCAEWEVPYSRVKHWALKWGIHFPNHVSARHKEAAARNWQKALEAQRSKLGERPDGVVSELVEMCGSLNQVARLLGVRVQRVSEWHNGIRPVPEKHMPAIEKLLSQPRASLIHKQRPHPGNANHCWRATA